MKSDQQRWSREELMLVLNQYCQMSFGSMHAKNPVVIRLAGLLGRTPGAVAYKLVNFASFDPELQKRGIKGASNASKLDREIWDSFSQNWEVFLFESEQIRARFENNTVERLHHLAERDMPREGKEREVWVRQRVNQHIFRRMILGAYDSTCCITGIQQAEFIIAGHIKPWHDDIANRMNPMNGIALNALHDKAFEHGFITITPQYTIRISPHILEQKGPEMHAYFKQYDRQHIRLPRRFFPDPAFLQYHNDVRFKSA